MPEERQHTGAPPANGPIVGRSALVRCPTCGAGQEWSTQCRRCQCDLTLLWSAARTGGAHRRAALAALHAGRLGDALIHARRSHRIHPDQRSARLLAVCYLLAGDWPSALATARVAEGSSP